VRAEPAAEDAAAAAAARLVRERLAAARERLKDC
jgi:hypothetical protein